MSPGPINKFLTVHGHFYQPPRENPWLEAVEVEEGAAPYHDWNERITAECYAPNAASLEKISFNFGPTLLSWLQSCRPETYAKIVEADRISQQQRGGHGNAIAQAYNHLILPLASRRDKVTQVRWGIEDFRHRFGRDPEGMWLPETAVDKETLAVLAEAGLKFTILAPTQARRIRPIEGVPWKSVEGGKIDPSLAYRWASGADPSLALFFYDSPISRAIAFEGALADGETLRARLVGGLSAERTWPQLVNVATDGESYGHHHEGGDEALTAALRDIESGGDAMLTNYGAFLAAHPPTHEVEIAERTSWSCVHGVERWRADCGCRTGRAAWHQPWRAPLRETMDWLRDQLDPFYEVRLGKLVKNPWDARDDYIQVILDRAEESRAAFFSRHQRGPLEPPRQVEALRLLELQRQRLLMFTSCGWFFDDISGLEATQVLKYAARAMQLGGGLGFSGLEEEFARRLKAAPSNVSDYGNGAQVFRRAVLPARVDVKRLVAHYAITALFEDPGEERRIFAFRVTRLDAKRAAAGGTTLMIGRVRALSEITDEVEEACYAVLHLGDQDFHCSVGSLPGAAAYEAAKTDLLARYLTGSPSEAVGAMDHHFAGRAFSLKDPFLDERRRILFGVGVRPE